MTRRPVASRKRDGGFTLIEVLAAFVILALFTVAIQRNVVAAAWNTARADARTAAEAVAATLLDGPLVGPGGAPLPTSGTLNGFSWTLSVEPLSSDRFGAARTPDGEASSWILVRVSVEVRSTDNRRAVARAQVIRPVRATP